MREKQTRRQFLQIAGIGAAVSLTGANSCLGQDQSKSTGKRLFHLGLASYTFREFKLAETLTMTRRLGLEYIALKSFHLPLESTQAEMATREHQGH